MLDFVLSGGALVDGSGNAGREADVGIAGDRIVAIGDLSGSEASRIVDVSGCVVCPGFIDIHTHHNSQMDGGIENIPGADNYLRQGVTTCVGGNCGGGTWPVGPHLERVSQLPIRTNYALLVGCNTARSKVLSEERPATTDEIARMCDVIRQGLEEGAIGMSSGVMYLPFLTTDEMTAMSKVVAEFGAFYASHIRNESAGLLASVDEHIEVGRRSGAVVEISHIKCHGREWWGLSDQVLEQVEAARAEGVDVTADAYPYIGSFTGLSGVVFGQEVMHRASRYGGIRALLQSPIREMALPNFEAAMEKYRGGKDIILAPLDPHPEFQGKTLAQYVSETGLGAYEATVALCGTPGHLCAIYLAMCEEDLCAFLRSPHVMVGSDGHLRIFGKSFSHPRNFGTFPRVLARYVREQGILTLEEAVRKMTSLPADRLGLKKRGRIAEGMVADITVFDPERVRDTATFTEGNSYSEGFELVLLAGQVALEKDAPTPTCHGRVIRRGEG